MFTCSLSSMFLYSMRVTAATTQSKKKGRRYGSTEAWRLLIFVQLEVTKPEGPKKSQKRKTSSFRKPKIKLPPTRIELVSADIHLLSIRRCHTPVWDRDDNRYTTEAPHRLLCLAFSSFLFLNFAPHPGYVFVLPYLLCTQSSGRHSTPLFFEKWTKGLDLWNFNFHNGSLFGNMHMYSGSHLMLEH